MKHSEETKRKISMANKGRKKPPRTLEHRRKHSEAMKGKKWSEETREKNRLSHLGEKAYNWKGGLNRTFQRNHHPKYKYALSIKPIACDICFIPESNLRKKLSFDHDHANNNFRGWLCANCNHALGFVKDDEKILLSMISYLRKSRDVDPEISK